MPGFFHSKYKTKAKSVEWSIGIYLSHKEHEICFAMAFKSVKTLKNGYFICYNATLKDVLGIYLDNLWNAALNEKLKEIVISEQALFLQNQNGLTYMKFTKNFMSFSISTRLSLSAQP